MSWLPHKRHTIVSELSKRDVLVRLQNYTQEVNSEYITEKPLFNGKVGADGFRVSAVINTPQNSLPLIIGKVEATKLGCIIFLQLSLFPAAILYLRISSSLAFFLAMIFLILSGWVTAGLVSLGIALLNYLVVTLSFHQKCKEAIRAIENLLDRHH